MIYLQLVKLLKSKQLLDSTIELLQNGNLYTTILVNVSAFSIRFSTVYFWTLIYFYHHIIILLYCEI